MFYASIASEIPCISKGTKDMVNMVARVYLLKGSEYIPIISLLKKTFGKHI